MNEGLPAPCRNGVSADGGGFLASGVGPRTGCKFKLGQLLYMRLKVTGDTTAGEASAGRAATIRHKAPHMKESGPFAGINILQTHAASTSWPAKRFSPRRSRALAPCDRTRWLPAL